MATAIAILLMNAGWATVAAQDKAMMVISSYLPEILAISDRVLVARGERIVKEMSAAAAT